MINGNCIWINVSLITFKREKYLVISGLIDPWSTIVHFMEEISICVSVINQTISRLLYHVYIVKIKSFRLPRLILRYAPDWLSDVISSGIYFSVRMRIVLCIRYIAHLLYNPYNTAFTEFLFLCSSRREYLISLLLQSPSSLLHRCNAHARRKNKTLPPPREHISRYAALPYPRKRSTTIHGRLDEDENPRFGGNLRSCCWSRCRCASSDGNQSLSTDPCFFFSFSKLLWDVMVGTLYYVSQFYSYLLDTFPRKLGGKNLDKTI